jgi:MFS family permease
MYQIENTQPLLRGGWRVLVRRSNWPRVGRNVFLIGLVSLFTDVSSEMVATILPLYLVYSLGLSPLQYGVIDGLHNGASAVIRLGAGFVGDRSRRHKEVAAVGYGLSAVTRIAFLAAGSSVAALSAIVFTDRVGKGIRTAPRDALISLSVARKDLGAAFGVHRALDTTGAMLGPLIAFVILSLAAGAYDAIFVTSFCFALVGFSILVLFVQNRTASDEEETSTASDDAEPSEDAASFRAAVGLLGNRRFQTLVAVAAGLSLVTISDGFFYLTLQQTLDFDPRTLPLLFVGTAFVFMVLAIPMGQLADRVGRGRVFIGGYALLLAAYALLLLPAFGHGELVVYVALLGAYYAATDGVLMALASSITPPALRGSGLALVLTASSIARLVASLAFGALWTVAGIESAIAVFAVGLVLALPLSALGLALTKPRTAYA